MNQWIVNFTKAFFRSLLIVLCIGITGAQAIEPASFRVTGPYLHKNLSLYLVHGEDQIEDKEILTLSEALERDLIRVHETGAVQQLLVENLSDEKIIFIQAGDIVKGGKQDRVLTRDMLLKPGSGKQDVNSYCVERGRWSKRGTEEVQEFKKSNKKLTGKALKAAALYSGAQNDVWKEVENIQDKLTSQIGKEVKSTLSQSSLQLALEDEDVALRVASYNSALKKIVSQHKDAIGYAFAINGELNSADVYGSTGLFAKLWPDLLEAAATESIAEFKKGKRVESPSPMKVQSFLLETEKGAKRGDLSSGDVLETREAENGFFQENRISKNGSSERSKWVHRNYLKK